ncbi:MAG TPA: 2-amino-4-hydroxy-6-hydroxymethyldihydropteridine diphosphokinase [Rhizomicrobium sp.]|jgi:2-amino-4-hydroxy-6-hydroxymethyldihydropteridine diphosphokinase
MILVALGSNLNSQFGPPGPTLHAALAALADSQIRIDSVSRFYETAAWPDPSEPIYTNAIAKLSTKLTPEALLSHLHSVERSFGRVRDTTYSSRTLDLDILDYDGRVQDGPPILPHPRMANRGFVLIPLRDVAPDWRHPVSGTSLDDLIAALPPDEQTAKLAKS